MPHKVTVGQRVEFIGKNGPTKKVGKVVILDNGPGKPIGIDFDNPIAFGHDCDGKAKPGCGWWALDEEVTPA